ncbi:MAG: U32 family peptidase [Bacteroidales bacterium]|nr:U32 family peptidase [Bacteroidales bacterium]
MQLTRLELLAPARNAEIGIAAIDCGADAVYIAGPAFGARAAAGNEIADIARLCRYAHLYGARIFATVNTLVREEELPAALQLMQQLYEAGVDVFIIQDLNLLAQPLPPVELHASTQTAIRTPERARELEALGFKRIVLERQLTLEQVRAIRDAVSCELEFFIHGAICVGYSGQCYLSQQLTGRSANRGACAQACRSRYDLVDADGRVIVRDRTLLSPRDLRLDGRIDDLVAAGITSFKIEGRLKNASYVKNIVRHYRNVIDRFIATHDGFAPASAGRIEGGFTPDPDRTFNRGYTEAFLDGRTGSLASVDAAKALGEYIGEITVVRGRDILLKGDRPLVNGDGLSFVGRSDAVTGARAEVVQGNRVTLRDTAGLAPGMRVYRNWDASFERELEKNLPRRVIDVAVRYSSRSGETRLTAVTEDGLTAELSFPETAEPANDAARARASLQAQLAKHTDIFRFRVEAIDTDTDYFYPAARINGWRRDLAAALRQQAENRPRPEVPHTPQPAAGAFNRSTLDLPVELLRSRYCIRWELGLCPKQHPAHAPKEPLFLVNQSNRLRLSFDCKNCEMIVSAS